jgi:hypothetical protein
MVFFNAACVRRIVLLRNFLQGHRCKNIYRREVKYSQLMSKYNKINVFLHIGTTRQPE